MEGHQWLLVVTAVLLVGAGAINVHQYLRNQGARKMMVSPAVAARREAAATTPPQALPVAPFSRVAQPWPDEEKLRKAQPLVGQPADMVEDETWDLVPNVPPCGEPGLVYGKGTGDTGCPQIFVPGVETPQQCQEKCQTSKATEMECNWWSWAPAGQAPHHWNSGGRPTCSLLPWVHGAHCSRASNKGKGFASGPAKCFSGIPHQDVDWMIPRRESDYVTQIKNLYQCRIPGLAEMRRRLSECSGGRNISHWQIYHRTASAGRSYDTQPDGKASFHGIAINWGASARDEKCDLRLADLSPALDALSWGWGEGAPTLALGLAWRCLGLPRIASIASWKQKDKDLAAPCGRLDDIPHIPIGVTMTYSQIGGPFYEKVARVSLNLRRAVMDCFGVKWPGDLDGTWGNPHMEKWAGRQWTHPCCGYMITTDDALASYSKLISIVMLQLSRRLRGYGDASAQCIMWKSRGGCLWRYWSYVIERLFILWLYSTQQIAAVRPQSDGPECKSYAADPTKHKRLYGTLTMEQINTVFEDVVVNGGTCPMRGDNLTVDDEGTDWRCEAECMGCGNQYFGCRKLPAPPACSIRLKGRKRVKVCRKCGQGKRLDNGALVCVG